jgi:hypothetical protein
LIIPSEYDLSKELSDDDEFVFFRKDFTTILLKLVSIPYIKELFVNNINTKFENILKGQVNNHYEMELALYLLNILQVSLNNNEYENDNIKKALGYLFTINFTEINSDIILLLYYETLHRYQIVILANHEALIHVIKTFLGSRGILIQNVKIGVKICNIFDKFLDKAKMLVTDIRQDVINALMYLINNIIDNKNFLLLIEYNILFHSLSLVTAEKIIESNEAQYYIYNEIFNLFNKIFVNYGVDEDKFIEISKLITSYLKGFPNEVGNTKIFINFLNTLYNDIYAKVITSEKAKYAMITMLQRFIYILGRDSAQYVEYFLLNQIRYPSIEIYEDSIKLLHNLTQLLKKGAKQIVKNTFYLFYTTIKNCKIPTEDVSDEDKTYIMVYSNFIKLISNITGEETVELIFDEGLDNVNIEELLNYLNYVASQIIDSFVNFCFK